MVDLGIALGITAAIVVAYIVVDRSIGRGRILFFFITSQLSFYPHIGILLFAIAAPWQNPQHVASYYATAFSSLIATFPIRRRVIPLYERYRRRWNLFCVVCGLSAGMRALNDLRPSAFLVLAVYCFGFGCLFWAETDDLDRDAAADDWPVARNDQPH